MMDGGVEIRSKAGREVVYPQRHAAAGVSTGAAEAAVYSQERLEAERRRSRASGNYSLSKKSLAIFILYMK